jgi:hypothetical protein
MVFKLLLLNSSFHINFLYLIISLSLSLSLCKQLICSGSYMGTIYCYDNDFEAHITTRQLKRALSTLPFLLVSGPEAGGGDRATGGGGGGGAASAAAVAL